MPKYRFEKEQRVDLPGDHGTLTIQLLVSSIGGRTSPDEIRIDAAPEVLEWIMDEVPALAQAKFDAPTE